MEIRYKIPTTSVLFNYFIFILPVLFLLFELLLTQTVTKSQSSSFFLHPLFIAYVLLSFLVPHFCVAMPPRKSESTMEVLKRARWRTRRPLPLQSFPSICPSSCLLSLPLPQSLSKAASPLSFSCNPLVRARSLPWQPT